MIEGSADKSPRSASSRPWLSPTRRSSRHQGDQGPRRRRRKDQAPSSTSLTPSPSCSSHHRARSPAEDRRRHFRQGEGRRSANVKALKEEAKAALVAEIPEASFADEELAVVFEDLRYKAYRSTILERGVRADGRARSRFARSPAKSACCPASHGSAALPPRRNPGPGPRDPRPDRGGPGHGRPTPAGDLASRSSSITTSRPSRSVKPAAHRPGPPRNRPRRARRAFARARPSPENEFPYAIRITSEIMASNGSTSMACVCGGCLALMDAGVPIKPPVAGISGGLVTENAADGSISKCGHRSPTFSASEDHYGDMDFNLCGTTGDHRLPARPEAPRHPLRSPRSRSTRPTTPASRS